MVVPSHISICCLSSKHAVLWNKSNDGYNNLDLYSSNLYSYLSCEIEKKFNTSKFGLQFVLLYNLLFYYTFVPLKVLYVRTIDKKVQRVIQWDAEFERRNQECYIHRDEQTST